MRLFVYATLRNKHTQIRAMGHEAVDTEAILPGYREIRGAWPTLERVSVGYTNGELLLVSQTDLEKLDKWEDRYKRIQVRTNKGQAFTYVLRKL